jgi:hypothetical protein
MINYKIFCQISVVREKDTNSVKNNSAIQQTITTYWLSNFFVFINLEYEGVASLEWHPMGDSESNSGILNQFKEHTNNPRRSVFYD